MWNTSSGSTGADSQKEQRKASMWDQSSGTIESSTSKDQSKTSPWNTRKTASGMYVGENAL